MIKSFSQQFSPAFHFFLPFLSSVDISCSSVFVEESNLKRRRRRRQFLSSVSLSRRWRSVSCTSAKNKSHRCCFFLIDQCSHGMKRQKLISLVCSLVRQLINLHSSKFKSLMNDSFSRVFVYLFALSVCDWVYLSRLVSWSCSQWIHSVGTEVAKQPEIYSTSWAVCLYNVISSCERRRRPRLNERQIHIVSIAHPSLAFTLFTFNLPPPLPALSTLQPFSLPLSPPNKQMHMKFIGEKNFHPNTH